MSRRATVLMTAGVVLVAVAIFAARVSSGVTTALASGVGFAMIVAIPLAVNQYLARRRRDRRP